MNDPKIGDIGSMVDESNTATTEDQDSIIERLRRLEAQNKEQLAILNDMAATLRNLGNGNQSTFIKKM